MGINWVKTTGKITKPTADIEVRYYKGVNARFEFKISKGALAVKFRNAQRLMVGMNDSLTRLYFCPTEERDGYKIIIKGYCAYTCATESRMAEFFPTLAPSTLVGTYNLKYDEQEKLYYISIGALPR